MKTILENLEKEFHKIFGTPCEHIYFAPGRVNLIGEHTDYNGGHVFPCALDLGTYALVTSRQDRELHFYSGNFPNSGIVISNLDALEKTSESHWTDYPKGVIWAFKHHGFDVSQGLNIYIYGNIPNGSGLSSSASLEVVIGLMLRDIFQWKDISLTDIALMGQFSENHYNGCNCGIMDQFASANGKKDHAIFLDTHTLKYNYAPLSLKDASLVVINSKVKHSLASSAYNDRRRECETALSILKEHSPIEELCEMNMEDFQKYKALLTDPVIQKRAQHAISENQRTLQSLEALNQGNIEAFGSLMNESHRSLRDDYEVSCRELDLLAEYAWEQEGVYGARMTGGGFGGCTVNIVKKENCDEFIKNISTYYEKETGMVPEFYVVNAGNGATIIK